MGHGVNINQVYTIRILVHNRFYFWAPSKSQNILFMLIRITLQNATQISVNPKLMPFDKKSTSVFKSFWLRARVSMFTLSLQ
jgi:hypothetical protein